MRNCEDLKNAVVIQTVKDYRKNMMKLLQRQTTYQQQKRKQQPTPKKPQFQKKQSLRERIPKPKKKPTQPPTKAKIPLHLIIIIFLRFAIDKDGLI